MNPFYLISNISVVYNHIHLNANTSVNNQIKEGLKNMETKISLSKANLYKYFENLLQMKV